MLMERVLRKEHSDTSKSVFYFVNLLQQMKRYKDIGVFYRRAYSRYGKTLEEKHPITIAYLRHYASMLEEKQD